MSTRTNLTVRGEKASKLLASVTDSEVGFAQIGEASFCLFQKKDYQEKGEDEIREQVATAMEELGCRQHDFRTLGLDNGGTLIVMQGKLIGVILPEDNGKSQEASLFRTLTAREQLRADCAAGKIRRIVKNW